MGRKETDFLESLFNALNATGTSVKRSTGFRGNKKAIVHNCRTGTTSGYAHNQGFSGHHTDVQVTRNEREVRRGHIKRHFSGNDTETLEHNLGRVHRSARKPNTRFFGNREQSTHYDYYGNPNGEGNWHRNQVFNTPPTEFRGVCFRCNGTGIFQPTGKTCRKCGGTGIFRKQM